MPSPPSNSLPSQPETSLASQPMIAQEPAISHLQREFRRAIRFRDVVQDSGGELAREQKDLRRTRPRLPTYPRPPLSPPTLFDPPNQHTDFAAQPRHLAFRPSSPPSPAHSSLSRTLLANEEGGAAGVEQARRRRRAEQDHQDDQYPGAPRRVITRPRSPSSFGFATLTTPPLVRRASSFFERDGVLRADEFGRRSIHGRVFEGEPRGRVRKRARRDVADFDPRPASQSLRLFPPTQSLPHLAEPYFTILLPHTSPLHPGSPFTIQVHLSPFAISHAPETIHLELSAHSISPSSIHLLFSRTLVERIDPGPILSFDARIPLGGNCESCGMEHGTLPPSFGQGGEGIGGYRTVYVVVATLGDRWFRRRFRSSRRWRGGRGWGEG